MKSSEEPFKQPFLPRMNTDKYEFWGKQLGSQIANFLNFTNEIEHPPPTIHYHRPKNYEKRENREKWGKILKKRSKRRENDENGSKNLLETHFNSQFTTA